MCMRNLNEEILNSWLNVTMSINNEKIVDSMTLNEMLICRLLYKNHVMTATELCSYLKMQKSQMNRTLTIMEEKHLISRARSNEDKRNIYVSLVQENLEVYQKEHARILKIVDYFIEKIGPEKAEQTLELFNLIADIAQQEE